MSKSNENTTEAPKLSNVLTDCVARFRELKDAKAESTLVFWCERQIELGDTVKDHWDELAKILKIRGANAVNIAKALEYPEASIALEKHLAKPAAKKAYENIGYDKNGKAKKTYKAHDITWSEACANAREKVWSGAKSKPKAVVKAIFEKAVEVSPMDKINADLAKTMATFSKQIERAENAGADTDNVLGVLETLEAAIKAMQEE